MKPADDPRIDYKRLVRAGYDQCATAYMEAREKGRSDLESLLNRLPPNSRVLDLGCGSGVPVARVLAEQHSVIGVDFSESQLRLARRNVPAATFIHADLATVEFAEGAFDAILAFYVLFHLPRDEQLALLKSIRTWLKPGGYFLATLSKRNEEPYTESDFFGTEMFWTNFALDEYVRYLRELGFELVEAPSLTDGYDENHLPEEHPVLLVRKPRQDS